MLKTESYIHFQENDGGIYIFFKEDHLTTLEIHGT